MKSYFLFEPYIETHRVCHNQDTDLCVNCEELECEQAGSGKHVSMKEGVA